jgi:hypothetical protein
VEKYCLVKPLEALFANFRIIGRRLFSVFQNKALVNPISDNCENDTNRVKDGHS